MSPLALRIYTHLTARLRRSKHSITYGELAAAVDVHPRSPVLHAALGEVSNACRHQQLPCIPAMVWRADSKRPSDGYYKVAHPRAHTPEAQRSAWEREHARVVAGASTFPRRLGSEREDQRNRDSLPGRAMRAARNLTHSAGTERSTNARR